MQSVQLEEPHTMNAVTGKQSIALAQRSVVNAQRTQLDTTFLSGSAQKFMGASLRTKQAVPMVASCRNVTVMAAKGTNHGTLYYIMLKIYN